VEGFSHEEIAAKLGIAPGTSKSQLFHARRSLRAILEPSLSASVA
jgi:RNA polymerase sigma-70 factor (ECF subfamily)